MTAVGPTAEVEAVLALQTVPAPADNVVLTTKSYVDTQVATRTTDQAVGAKITAVTGIQSVDDFNAVRNLLYIHEQNFPRAINLGLLQNTEGLTYADPGNPSNAGYLQANALYIVPNPLVLFGFTYGLFSFGNPLDTTVNGAFVFSVYNASATIGLRLWGAQIYVRGTQQGWALSLALIPPKRKAMYLYLPSSVTPYRRSGTALPTIVEYDAIATETTVMNPINA